MSRQTGKKSSDANLKIFRANKEDMEKFSNEIQFWSNGLGEIHNHGVSISEEELPSALQQAYKDLWTDEYGSLCYLVETPQGCGVALLNEYDQCYADDLKFTMDNLFQFVLEDGYAISRRPEFQNATFYIGEYSGFCECHELIAVFPATTPVNEFKTAASLLDKLVYQSAKRHSKHLNQELVRMTKNNMPNEMLRLIQEGADVNYKDRFGVPVLHWATNHANSHTIELLVEHGADVNVQSKEGITKLMLMASYGDIEVVSYLLEHGANARIEDREGRNALSFAKNMLSNYMAYSEIESDKYKKVIGLLEKAMLRENKSSLDSQIQSAATHATEYNRDDNNQQGGHFMSEHPKIYLTPNTDRTWSASVCSTPPPSLSAVLMTEPSYPTDVYYARTDINGSRIVESDKCSNREELLSSLNWIGQCCFSLLVVAEKDFREELPIDLVKIFDNAYERRSEMMEQAANEFLAALSDISSNTSLEDQINDMAWDVDCKLSTPCNVMSVQIQFSHEENSCDETEFDITAWDANELSDLFDVFCRENQFKDVSINGLTVVNTASSFDELIKSEKKRPLDVQIQSASTRAAEANSTDKAHGKDFAPER